MRIREGGKAHLDKRTLHAPALDAVSSPTKDANPGLPEKLDTMQLVAAYILCPFLCSFFPYLSRNSLSCFSGLRFSIPICYSSTGYHHAYMCMLLFSILLFIATLSHTSSDMRLHFPIYGYLRHRHVRV